MAKQQHTETTMLALLEARYRQTSGNGPAWAFIPKVRNAAGFDATRDNLRRRIQEFEEASGLNLGSWQHSFEPGDVEQIGKLVRLAMDGDLQVERFEQRLEQIALQAETLAAAARAAIPDRAAA